MLDLLLGVLSTQAFHEDIFKALKEQDRRVYDLITKEYERLQNSLQLLAAENQCSGAVLAALGSVVQNKTAYGFPGARYHGGCEVVDDVERLAAERAREVFGAQYANVQPHSGTSANQIVLTAMMDRGDKVMSLGLTQGGHLSHGAKVSFSGKFFDIENYYVDKETFLLDYDSIGRQAEEVRPKLIICGASAYSRTIDFEKFREIADRVGAYLLADISHIAGLVAAGAHKSPVDYAHFTTTSTYKPGGPRGGLILVGRDYDRKINVMGENITLWEHIERTVFPGVQGTPYLNNVAAKAVFLKEAMSDEYKARQFKIISNAKKLSEGLTALGFDVLTGGTDNHMFLVDVSNLRDGLTGWMAQRCLEDCGIVVDKHRLPHDSTDASVTSGIRLGTPIITKNGMDSAEMESIAELIDVVFKEVKLKGGGEYELNESFVKEIRDTVKQMCHRFPMR